MSNRIVFLIYLLLISWFIHKLHFLDKIDFLCPIEYDRDIIIRNDKRGKGDFGSSRNGGRIHNGLDLMAAIGSRVRAARSGKVINAEFNRGLGNYVEILHPGGLVSIYGHLKTIEVNRGDYVQQSTVLGTVGKTGNANHPSIQPHLHFELRKDNFPQDPFSGYLKN